MNRDKLAEFSERRRHNRESSPLRLNENAIEYTTHNNGAHLVVKGVGETIDFWPGAGLWVVRKKNKDGTGVFNLIKYIARMKERLK